MRIQPLPLLVLIAAALLLGGCGTPRFVQNAVVQAAPPEGKAIINVYAQSIDSWPVFLEGKTLVAAPKGYTVTQIVVEPGDHTLLLRYDVKDRAAAITVSTTANHIYDVMADSSLAWGSGDSYLSWGKFGRYLYLKPVMPTGEDRDTLTKKMGKYSAITIDRSDQKVAQMEQEYAADNAAVLVEFRAGKKIDDAVLQILTADQFRH